MGKKYYDNEAGVTLHDAAVDYCNKNHSGADRKYAACYSSFIAGADWQSSLPASTDKGQEEMYLKIQPYQAKQIQEALRMVVTTYDCEAKVTCLDRNVMQAYKMIQNVASGKPDEVVKYM